MRLVTLANGPFAVPMLHKLAGSRHDVKMVLVRPRRLGRGRHHHPPPSPIEQAARDHGLEVLAPPTVNDETVRRTIGACEPDLLVVCDYGEILHAETLAVGRLGSINLHGSLLPKYRGAAPVAWAIYHGETETGTTVFQLTPGIDAGPILGQRSIPIDPEETTGDLEQRLAEQGADLVLEVLDHIDAGTAQPIPQEKALVSKAPRLVKADGSIDWSRPAAAIQNQVRAMQPWPRAYTHWQRRQGDPVRLIVMKTALPQQTEPVDEAVGHPPHRPGTVMDTQNRLVVAAGDGPIEIHTIQPAGKRAMTASEFLRGYAVQPGDRFE